MADRATDLFASAGGLDALAFAIEHQRSTSSAGTPPPANGPSAAPALHHQQQQQQQHNGTAAGTAQYGSSQIDGFEAASLLGALSGGHSQQHGASSHPPPPPPGAPFDQPHLGHLASSSSSSQAAQPPGGPSTVPPGPPTAPPADGDVPIPPELLQWDDTLTTAERVKLDKRAVPAPSSSPNVKKEPAPAAGKAPARKKKPKTTVGAVAAAAAAAGSPKAKPPAGKGKGKAAGAASAKAPAAKGAASASAPAASSSSSATAAAAAPAVPAVKKDKGKFLGLGRAWRKGLNISGDRLKEMTREEIERELVAKGTWVPGMAAAAAGNATASGSGSGATAAAGASASGAPAKKPASAKTSGSTAAPTSAAGTSTKKKAAPKSATPSAVAGSSSSAVPAKRKAPATAEGKSKKSSKSTAKKTILSATASLSRGRNSSSPGASRSRSATADGRGSFSVEPSVPPPDPKDDDDDEKDDSLYCLCQELYDEDRAMLACDICEQWFHPSCVGLPEDRIDLVGQFICPRCVEHTDERTTWKTKCQTDGCFKSAVPGLTKYCSTSCGETHLVRLLEDAGLPRRHFEVYTADAQPPSGACIPNGDFPGGPPFVAPAADEPRRQLLGRAADLGRSIAAVEGHLGLLGKRLALLSLATRRADLVQLDSNGALLINPAPGQEQQQAAKPAQEEPYNPKKKKSKFDSGPAANRVCGFDERLVLDEAEWAAWVRSDEGEQTVGALDVGPPEADDAPRDVVQYMQREGDWWCGKSKKRCDAHSAWHKIRLDDFLLEQSAKQTQLAALRDSLQATQKEVDLADRRASQKREVDGEDAMDVDAAPASAAVGDAADEPIEDEAMADEPPVKAEPGEDGQDVADDAPPPSPRPNGDGAREHLSKLVPVADRPTEEPSDKGEGEQPSRSPAAAAVKEDGAAPAGDEQTMRS